MAAIVACLISDQIIQLGVLAYAGLMVEDLGAVEDKDKAGEVSWGTVAAKLISRWPPARCTAKT